MSRPWRIEHEGALYHLLSRGKERSDILIDEKDRGNLSNRQAICLELLSGQSRGKVDKSKITKRSGVKASIQ